MAIGETPGRPKSQVDDHFATSELLVPCFPWENVRSGQNLLVLETSGPG